MQAITTDYMPNTGRVKVQCAAKTKLMHPPGNLNTEEQRIFCVKEFLRELDEEVGGNTWNQPFATGQMKDGRYVHVFID